MKAIVMANGSIEYGPAVDGALRLAFRGGAYCIAVDGGGDHMRRLGITPELIIGDLDSITTDALHTYASQGVEVIRFPAEKDETDLELALIEATRRGATWIRILAAVGDRMDQTIANIYLLALPCLNDVDTRIVNGKQTMWLLSAGKHLIFGDVGDTISLIPLDGNVTDIRTHGLAYPLSGDTLFTGPARGISNVIESANAQLSFESGKLLVIHTVGRA